VNARAATPHWMAQRLERSGLRSISAIVDVTNYVMLELGQPSHAFDADKLKGSINTRLARDGEKFLALDGKTYSLKPDSCVVATTGRLACWVARARRGVARHPGYFARGGIFAPDVVAGKSRVLGFGSDSAYVSASITLHRSCDRARDRAGAGDLRWTSGPVCRHRQRAQAVVRVRAARAQRLLGIQLAAHEIARLFARLGFACAQSGDEFNVTPPSYRFDLAIEEDLVEEVARVHGYDNIPANAPVAAGAMLPAPESRTEVAALRQLLVARDYQEITTASSTGNGKWI
jgi:phenylalanyl-tRNA synthetase beta chain